MKSRVVVLVLLSVMFAGCGEDLFKTIGDNYGSKKQMEVLKPIETVLDENKSN